MATKQNTIEILIKAKNLLTSETQKATQGVQQLSTATKQAGTSNTSFAKTFEQLRQASIKAAAQNRQYVDSLNRISTAATQVSKITPLTNMTMGARTGATEILRLSEGIVNLSQTSGSSFSNVSTRVQEVATRVKTATTNVIEFVKQGEWVKTIGQAFSTVGQLISSAASKIKNIAQSFINLAKQAGSVVSRIKNIAQSLLGLGQQADSTRQKTTMLDSVLNSAFGIAKGILYAQVITKITTGLTKMATSLVSLNADWEQWHTQFTVLLGSSEEATKRLEYLTDFAKRTPFDLPGVIEASRVLQVFGGDALATGEELTRMGDMAAAAGVNANELAMWYGRLFSMIQAGKGIGFEARRLQQLGLLTGEQRNSLEEMVKLVKAGELEADRVWAWFTGQMDRFSGLMDQQSKTFSGVVENISDTWEALRRTVGKPIFDVAKDVVQSLLNFLSSDKVQGGAKRLAAALGDIFDAIRDIGSEVRDVFSAFGVNELSIALVELGAALKNTLGIGEPIERVGSAYKSWAYAVSEHLRPALQWVQDHLDEAKAALNAFVKAIGTLVGMQLGIKAVGLAVGLLTSGIKALLSPVGLLTAAFFAWDQNLFGIRDRVTKLADTLKNVFGPAVKAALDSLKSGDIGGAVKSFVENLPEDFVQGFSDAFNATLSTNFATTIISKFVSVFRDVATWIVHDGIPTLLDALGTGIEQYYKLAGDMVRAVLPKLGTALAQIAAWVITDGIPGLIKIIIEDLPKLIGRLIGAFWNYFWGDFVPGIGDFAKNFIKTLYDEISKRVRGIDVFGAVTDAIKDLPRKIGEWFSTEGIPKISGFFTDLGHAIADKFTEILNAIPQSVKDGLAGLVDVLEDTVYALRGVLPDSENLLNNLRYAQDALRGSTIANAESWKYVREQLDKYNITAIDVYNEMQRGGGTLYEAAQRLYDNAVAADRASQASENLASTTSNTSSVILHGATDAYNAWRQMEVQGQNTANNVSNSMTQMSLNVIATFWNMNEQSQNAFRSLVNNVSSYANSLVNTLASKATVISNAMGGIFNSGISSIQRGISSVLGYIQSGIGSAIGGLTTSSTAGGWQTTTPLPVGSQVVQQELNIPSDIAQMIQQQAESSSETASAVAASAAQSQSNIVWLWDHQRDAIIWAVQQLNGARGNNLNIIEQMKASTLQIIEQIKVLSNELRAHLASGNDPHSLVGEGIRHILRLLDVDGILIRGQVGGDGATTGLSGLTTVQQSGIHASISPTGEIYTSWGYDPEANLAILGSRDSFGSKLDKWAAEQYAKQQGNTYNMTVNTNANSSSVVQDFQMMEAMG